MRWESRWWSGFVSADFFMTRGYRQLYRSRRFRAARRQRASDFCWGGSAFCHQKATSDCQRRSTLRCWLLLVQWRNSGERFEGYLLLPLSLFFINLGFDRCWHLQCASVSVFRVRSIWANADGRLAGWFAPPLSHWPLRYWLICLAHRGFTHA